MDDNTQGVTLDPEEELAGQLDQGQSETSPSDEQEEETPTEGQETENTDTEEEEITSKGTKVAKEPESRHYQNLKNELNEYKQVLSNPMLLRKVLEQMEGGTPKSNAEVKEDAKTLSKATPEEIRQFMDENGQVDVLGLIEYLDKRYETMTSQVSSGIARNVTREEATVREIKTTYDNQLSTLRRDYPELNPESEKYNPQFEKLVADKFLGMGGQQGKVTIKQAFDEVMNVINGYKAIGKKEAQTIVKKKAAGAIPSERNSGKPSNGGAPEDNDPEDMLNSRLFGAR